MVDFIHQSLGIEWVGFSKTFGFKTFGMHCMCCVVTENERGLPDSEKISQQTR